MKLPSFNKPRYIPDTRGRYSKFMDLLNKLEILYIVISAFIIYLYLTSTKVSIFFMPTLLSPLGK